MQKIQLIKLLYEIYISLQETRFNSHSIGEKELH